MNTGNWNGSNTTTVTTAGSGSKPSVIAGGGDDTASLKQIVPTTTTTIATSSVVVVQGREESSETACTEIESDMEEDQSSHVMNPELDWSFLHNGQLFGREVEVRALQDAIQRRLGLNGSMSGGNKPELVLVSGQSGTGKTALVKTALHDLVAKQNGGFFLFGKFDQLRSPEPYGPFVAALTHLAASLSKQEQEQEQGEETDRKNSNDSNSNDHNIALQVGREACQVLCALVPAFVKVFNLNDQDTKAMELKKTHDAQQDRLKVALIKLFQAVASTTSRPIVLVMDDLQWADKPSLDLLEALVVAQTSRQVGLQVVGVCRSNEVPWHHDFAGMLRRLEDEKDTTIHHIQVKCLSLGATITLISRMLKQPQSVCQPLAEIIHQKSHGNVFFMLQFLKTLHLEGVLVAERIQQQQHTSHSHTHSQNYQWLWNDERWNLQQQSSNLTVVDLVSHQIQRQSTEFQQFLQVAACLGAEFDLNVLITVLLAQQEQEQEQEQQSTPIPLDVQELATRAVQQGMIVQRQHWQQHHPERYQYAFTHDRIQQAAYSLVPDCDKPASHLTVGRALFQNLSPTDLEQNLFLVVNQLVRGMSLLTSEVDQNGLAELCLRAGHKASQSSDFESALGYFQIGIDLLSTAGKRPWRDEYYLSLALHNATAEAQCCLLAFEEMSDTIQQVLLNCRCFNDKITAYLTKIYSLGVQSNFRAAIDLGLEVLGSLGEKFPTKPHKLYLIPEYVQVKRRLKAMTDSDILQLKAMDMEDRTRMAACCILNQLTVYVFCADPDLFPFLILRWMKLTLRYGLCDISCLSFATYGVLLCALGEIEDAYRYARLAQQLLEDQSVSADNESPQAQLFARLTFYTYGAVFPWVKPLRTTFDTLRQGIEAAIESADMECAMFSSYKLIYHGYAAGNQLGIVEDQIRRYLPLMNQKGPWLALTLLQQRLVHALMGKSSANTSTDASGTSPSFDEWNDSIEISATACTAESKRDFQLYECIALTMRLQYWYHFGKLDLAYECARKSRVAEKVIKTHYIVVYQYFYDAMTVLEVAAQSCHHQCNNKQKQKQKQKAGGKQRRRRKHKKLISWAKRILVRLKKLAETSPSNILHKVYLLEGEMQALKGNLPAALGWYKKAMEHSALEGVTPLEALAYERAAISLKRLDLDPMMTRKSSSSSSSSSSSKDNEEDSASSASTVKEVRRLLQESIVRYERWGATAIVAHLKQKHHL